MKIGDLVKVVKNDMSLIIKIEGMKDNLFFDGVGTIVKEFPEMRWQMPYSWYEVLFPSGIYSAREDAIEVLSAN